MSYKLIFSIPFLAGGAGLAYSPAKAALLGPEQSAPVQAEHTLSAASTLIPLNADVPRSSSFNVKDRHGNYTYSLSQTRKTISVTETSALPNKRGYEGGGLSDFLYFDHAATRKFEREFATATHCPAPFFNRHSDQKTLYATDERIQKELKRWNNPTWKQTEKWKETKIIGRCITGTTNYTIRDEQMAPYVDPNSFSDCKQFYVESIVSRKPYRDG